MHWGLGSIPGEGACKSPAMNECMDEWNNKLVFLSQINNTFKKILIKEEKMCPYGKACHSYSTIKSCCILLLSGIVISIGWDNLPPFRFFIFTYNLFDID